MVLCDAGPKGGSAYLPMGAGCSSLSLRIWATSWQGSMQHCPALKLLPVRRAAGREGWEVCAMTHISVSGLANSACAPASKPHVGLHEANMTMCHMWLWICRSPTLCLYAYACLCAQVSYVGVHVHVCAYRCAPMCCESMRSV